MDTKERLDPLEDTCVDLLKAALFTIASIPYIWRFSDSEVIVMTHEDEKFLEKMAEDLSEFITNLENRE